VKNLPALFTITRSTTSPTLLEVLHSTTALHLSMMLIRHDRCITKSILPKQLVYATLVW